MYDLRPFIDAVEGIVASHQIEDGSYRRWLIAEGKDPERNPYGCADAANLLYTIGRFPRDPAARANWVHHLREMQDPGDGLWHEATHHPIHTTAHCAAALELFDAAPAYPMTALHQHRAPEAVAAFLDGLDWTGNPWNQSHRGAGLYAALSIAGEADAAFVDAYFDWLWAEADPETGFWRRGCVGPCTGRHNAVFPHLAGSFHYLFNLVAARMPLRYPDKMIDTCLRLRAENDFPSLGTAVGFAEIDWVFCITRALRQCGHRHGDCMDALRAFAAQYIPSLTERDPATDERLDDLHALFGALCCVAELQIALPGELRSEQPLKLVLDRRPFI